MNAVLYRYQAGIPWHDLLERFGDFRVVHTRLLALEQDANDKHAMIDNTIVRAHQRSAGAKGGSGQTGDRAQQKRLEHHLHKERHLVENLFGV